MKSVNEEFRIFMAATFPQVVAHSPQWEIMKLVWNSAICLAMSETTSVDLTDEEGAARMVKIHQESYDYCKQYITKEAANELN